MLMKRLLFIILALVSGIAVTQASELRNLRVNRMSHPQGIVRTGQFSWQIVSEENDVYQVAWYIKVASTREGLQGGPTMMWDSERREGADMVQVYYQGRRFPYDSTVYWQLEVWLSNNEHLQSPVQEFHTGSKGTVWNSTPLTADEPRQDYFRYLTQQELIQKNPMTAAPMIKKANFLAAQGKENRPTCETVTTFTPEEIEKFKAESYRTWSNGERIYQQAAAYTLMFNTGLRTGEVLGLLNSDVDLEHRVLHLRRGVKEVSRRDGVEFTSGREVKIGKLKSASSKRDVPLNQAAIDAILDLRVERYFGEDAPLIPDENGNYTRPVNFRRRYYRILEAAGIEQKGLHSIRHTFATTLVNGIRQPDGTIKSLTPRQVADLLGHSTSEITEMYYVKKDTARLGGITDGFEL